MKEYEHMKIEAYAIFQDDNILSENLFHYCSGCCCCYDSDPTNALAIYMSLPAAHAALKDTYNSHKYQITKIYIEKA